MHIINVRLQSGAEANPTANFGCLQEWRCPDHNAFVIVATIIAFHTGNREMLFQTLIT